MRVVDEPKELAVLPRAPEGLPTVEPDEMRELDRVLVDEVGLPLVTMMENAGRALARLADRLAPRWEATVLAGKGGNGGGGLAAARHLANRGWTVRVHLAAERDQLREATARQVRILDASDVPVEQGRPASPTDGLVIDALLGYSQAGPPRGTIEELTAWAERVEGPLLSLDVPTGLDPEEGTLHTPRVVSAATLTLVLPKTGLFAAPPEATGELLLADIGVPGPVYERFGAAAPVFPEGPLVRIERGR